MRGAFLAYIGWRDLRDLGTVNKIVAYVSWREIFALALELYDGMEKAFR
jgi:hypothetical protein